MTTRWISTTTEPITAAEVKTLVPIDGTDHDARIALLIPALRQQAEQYTGRSLATNVYQLKLDVFPAEIQLLWPPIVSVQSVQYYDTSAVLQTITDYTLDKHSEPGWLLPAASWPETYDMANAVIVNYTAGYGASAPEEVKLWIAAMIGCEIDGRDVSPYLNGLLDRLKVF